MAQLIDSYHRKFTYLRLSVTDQCNFRCEYCLPDGYQKNPLLQDSELDAKEISRLVTAFRNLGVTKVRLTGGEPTVRRDIIQVVKTIKDIAGIEKIALTTNGYRFSEIAEQLYQAGLNAVNISIDSLDENRFSKITGTSHKFKKIIEGVEHALSLGLETKINAVLLKDTCENDFETFLQWVRERPVSVRFIELMRTGKNQTYFDKNHISAGEIQFRLQKNNWLPVHRKLDSGPALEYAHPNYLGKIGIIAPYSKDFCKTCNRLRVSSRGALRLCLFGEKDCDLREYLQKDDQSESLVNRIAVCLREKPESHFLHQGKFGNTWNLAQIGG